MDALSPSELLQKFNHTFLEFGDDITHLMPQDAKLQMYIMATKAALTFQPEMVQQEFHTKIVVPFGDRILKRDESFFLQYDFAQEGDGVDGAEELIGKCKEIWHNLDAHNKDVIWKYFRVLVHLSRKIGI